MKNTVIIEPTNFFNDLVSEAIEERNVETSPLASSYISNLLTKYLHTESLFDETTESGKKRISTLAETYLKAMNSELRTQAELLKRLGDVSLYISGFFSESLNRKIVNVDYYVNMGETAFDTLAKSTQEEAYSNLYKEFSVHFVKFMDVLSLVSEKANMKGNLNLLRLLDTYQDTGSDLAKETLIEKGIYILDEAELKKTAQ